MKLFSMKLRLILFQNINFKTFKTRNIMEYIIPNLGQYGYVEPDSESDLKTFFAFLGGLILGFILFYHFFIKKDDDKKDNVDFLFLAP